MSLIRHQNLDFLANIALCEIVRNLHINSLKAKELLRMDNLYSEFALLKLTIL